jgi:hypothetical protein
MTNQYWEETEAYINFLIPTTDTILNNMQGEQDSLRRFIYCCTEKIHKSMHTLQFLLQKTIDDNNEFSMGLMLRSLMMDAILTQYLRYLTLQAANTDDLATIEKLKHQSLVFIADGTEHVIRDFVDFGDVPFSEKQKLTQRIANVFPGVFTINEKGIPKLNSQFKYKLRELHKQSEHAMQPTRKLVYDLYAYYSKYDHVSHWTSILNKLPLSEKIRKLQSAIVVILYNFRDLMVISTFDKDLKTRAWIMIQQIDTLVNWYNPKKVNENKP